MEVKSFNVGQLMSKAYIISENNQAIIIDPGAEGNKLYNYLKEKQLNLKYIINTHAHFDHIAANEFLKDKTKAEILAHPKAAKKFNDTKLNLSKLFMNKNITSPSLDRALDEGEEITFADLKFKIIYTPGHSEDSISVYFPEEKMIFSGDCIFANGVGRTDLEDSDFKKLKNSIESKLFELPDDCNFYPGHGPKSTISTFKNKVWPAIN